MRSFGAARRSNSASSLRRSRRALDPMAAYDRLPEELRQWLAQAALPWSPRSALRLWRRALARSKGNRARALAYLSEVEWAMLQRDGRMIWGQMHPGPSPRMAPDGGQLAAAAQVSLGREVEKRAR